MQLWLALQLLQLAPVVRSGVWYSQRCESGRRGIQGTLHSNGAPGAMQTLKKTQEIFIKEQQLHTE